MTVAIKYLVVEVGYEYDDEGYHAPEDNNMGIPNKLFANKQAAEKYCEILNIGRFKKINPLEYDPYRYELADEELFAEITTTKLDPYYVDLSKFHDDTIKQLMQKVFPHLRFFSVVTVEESE